MLKKIFSVIINVILILIPFFPVLENFFPKVDHTNFSSYLLCCAMVSLLMLGLVFLLRLDKNAQPKLFGATWLFFALGIIVMVPLHMGAPKKGVELLQSATEEKVRYAMLLLAIVLFAVGTIAALKPFWKSLKPIGKAILFPLGIAVLIAIWDNADSLMFSAKLIKWIDSGKNVNDFFQNYNFHQVWRAIGRMLLYVNAAWLSVVLYKQAIFKKWIAVGLTIFCLIGVGFCIAFLVVSPAFYFPFMVPALAMAPSYWIGIALLNTTAKH